MTSKSLLPTRMLLMKIKALLLTLVVIFSAFSFNSCKTKKEKDREYNESEVLEAARTLIKKSEILNEIYYGQGIEYDIGDTSNSNGYYYPADLMSLDKFGVTNVEDIKRLTRECFTTGQSDQMINTILSSIRNQSGDIIHFARYYQEYETLNENVEKCVMVYSKYDVLLVDTVEYFYDTLRVIGVKGQIIKVEIEANATSPAGNVQRKKIVIDLLEEANGFRIDSPTYVRNTDIQE